MYRTWSEEGNYMSAPDTFPEAFKDVMEFGGIVVDANNDIVLSVPEDLKENEVYMDTVRATNEW